MKNNRNKNTYIIESLNKKIFEEKNWNYAKRNISVLSENNSILIESKKRGVNYLTLFEKNTKFLVIKKYKVIFDKNTYFEIGGRKSGNIKVIFYLIEYDKKLKRINTNRLKLNE